MEFGEQKITVRRMSTEDLPKVKAIEKQCRLAEWTVGDYLKELKDERSILLVAILEEKIAGFLLARLIMNNNFPLFSKDYEIKVSEITEKEAEIYNIGVLPKYRRKGIGKTIMQHLLKKCCKEKVQCVWLEVRESNIDAQTFYKNLKFEKKYIRKNYYQNPEENALVMQLELSAKKNVSKPSSHSIT